MRYPSNRYRFSTRDSFFGKRKGTVLKNSMLSVLIIGIIAGCTILAIRIFSWQPFNKAELIDELYTKWENKEYSQILSISEAMLEKNPMDSNALVFKGFAHFYKGVTQLSEEQKIPYLDRSIASLRKAKLVSGYPLSSQVNYVLGKTYFHKGFYYMDLSIKYMKESIKQGFVGEDSYEYLALAYSNIQDYRTSINYFHKAIEKNPSDLLYLTLAQTYYQLKENDSAGKFLLRAINNTTDQEMKAKARFLLGDIYETKNEFHRAKEQYLKILEENSNSADAHFRLGEIYEKLNNNIMARAEWRKALRIDPNHFGALSRLYN